MDAELGLCQVVTCLPFTLSDNLEELKNGLAGDFGELSDIKEGRLVKEAGASTVMMRSSILQLAAKELISKGSNDTPLYDKSPPLPLFSLLIALRNENRSQSSGSKPGPELGIGADGGGKLFGGSEDMDYPSFTFSNLNVVALPNQSSNDSVFIPVSITLNIVIKGLPRNPRRETEEGGFPGRRIDREYGSQSGFESDQFRWVTAKRQRPN
nr:hypothetical protein Iba_chr07fCG10410 [Ipomoea batatas]